MPNDDGAAPHQCWAGAANRQAYEPPQRGAPEGRVGGSTRGMGTMPLLSVLAPDQTGLTVHEQPALFWYLTRETTSPVELTIRDDHATQPLLQVRLNGPLQVGLHRMRLAEHGVQLTLNVPYRWLITIVEPQRSSHGTMACGTIERVALPRHLRRQLARARPAQVPALYAEAGFWYDAVAAIADLRDANPEDPALRQQQSALLAQVGLRHITEHDGRHSRAP